MYHDFALFWLVVERLVSWIICAFAVAVWQPGELVALFCSFHRFFLEEHVYNISLLGVSRSGIVCS